MSFDWVGGFGFLRGNGAALLVLATAVFILMAPDVRLALMGLAVQYFALMLLYVDVLTPQLALVKLLVGWFVCLMLLVTGQQVNWGRTAARAERSRSVQMGGRQVSITAVRGVLALVVLGVVWLLAQQSVSFLPAPPEALAVNGLVGFGLLVMLTFAGKPLRAGMGMLMFLAGLELYFSTLAQSLVGLALLAALDLLVTLVIAYVTQKRYTAARNFQNQTL